MMAKWSLFSNALQHPIVREFCVDAAGQVEDWSEANMNRSLALLDIAANIGIVEPRLILPWKVTAVVAIFGQDMGVISGLGRSLLTFRGNDRVAVEFASLEDRFLAVALFLARPASSGNVESHEEIHEGT